MAKKLLIASSIAVVASIAATPSYAAVNIDEPLDTPGALSAPWVVSGTVDPTVVQEVGDTPEYALRLTNDDGSQNGFVLYNEAISVTAGIDVRFSQAQFGGDGADGIVFFIKDGADTDTNPGGTGGAMGYAPSSGDGLSGALLGIGLDGYGSFGTADVDGTGCADLGYVESTGGGDNNVIVLRGAGQGTEGYCRLADVASLDDLGLAPLVDGYSNRADAAADVRVVVDPVTANNPRVVVYYDDVEIINVPLPSEFADVSSVKIGFTAGTGGSVDFHDVWGLTATVSPNPPVLAETGVEITPIGFAAAGLIAAGGIALAVRRRKA